MEIGIDSFASAPQQLNNRHENNVKEIENLLNRIEIADKVGLDSFGIGEHHRPSFMDSATAVLLAAAAARTKKIKLSSAVTVLSAADPVRVFQQFATLDLISNGRAEIVAGRGSFTEAFPLFGFNLQDYDELFKEKLELLLQIRDNEFVNWSGKFRSPLLNQSVYPRPLQKKLPIWLGVGGSHHSFIRAGQLGLPLMIAVIGGETARFKHLIDKYKEAGIKAGHDPEQLTVGLHSLGFVADSSEEAHNRYYPGYAKTFTKIGLERGWPPVDRSRYNAQSGSGGALVVGSPEEVVEKISMHNKDLGGISRFTFMMDNAGLSHEELCRSIQLIGEKVYPNLQ